jgi:hypothetical protein
MLPWMREPCARRGIHAAGGRRRNQAREEMHAMRTQVYHRRGDSIHRPAEHHAGLRGLAGRQGLGEGLGMAGL